MSTLDEILSKIQARLASVDPSTRSVFYVFKYVITNESGAVIRTWLMDLKDSLTITDGNGAADCTFTLTEKMLIEILGENKTKMEDAVADGRVKFEGNKEAFAALQKKA